MVIQKLFSVKQEKLRILSVEGLVCYAASEGVKSRPGTFPVNKDFQVVRYYIAVGDYAARTGHKRLAAQCYRYTFKKNFLTLPACSAPSGKRLFRQILKKLFALHTSYSWKIHKELEKEYVYHLYLKKELLRMEKKFLKKSGGTPEI